jgi:hypothetical protein
MFLSYLPVIKHGNGKSNVDGGFMVLLRTSPVNGLLVQDIHPSLKMGPCPLSWPHPFELAFCVGLMFFQTCRAEAEQVWASWDSRSGDW